MWGWVGWIIVALTVWASVAVFLAVLLGRVVRHRDQQVPTDMVEPPAPPLRTRVGEPPVPEHRPRT